MKRLAAWARRNWLAAGLVLSLVLNGFLIGMLAVESLPKHRGGGPRAMNFELRHLARRLPRAAVDQIARELQPVAPAIQARVDRLRALRDEINRLAAEPQPDRAAIDSRLEALRTEALALQAEVHKATFDALLRLPPETRAALAAGERRG